MVNSLEFFVLTIMASRRKLTEEFLQLLKESEGKCKETEGSTLDPNDADEIDQASKISDRDSKSVLWNLRMEEWTIYF